MSRCSWARQMPFWPLRRVQPQSHGDVVRGRIGEVAAVRIRTVNAQEIDLRLVDEASVDAVAIGPTCLERHRDHTGLRSSVLHLDPQEPTFTIRTEIERFV